MNKNVKYQWISALESGEYELTSNRLHDNDGFSAIGVLCDLFIRSDDNIVNARWLSKGNFFVYSDFYENQYSEIPQAVLDWADCDNPTFLSEIDENNKFEVDALAIAGYIIGKEDG